METGVRELVITEEKSRREKGSERDKEWGKLLNYMGIVNNCCMEFKNTDELIFDPAIGGKGI